MHIKLSYCKVMFIQKQRLQKAFLQQAENVQQLHYSTIERKSQLSANFSCKKSCTKIVLELRISYKLIVLHINKSAILFVF